ncbi:MAG: hypothetical protein ACOH1Y_09270 [Propionicimonas sp.]
MSTLDWIALVGNILTAVSIVPHLMQAIRTRRPVGSVLGWCLSSASGGFWLAYGLVAHMPEIGAPGWVTVPVSTVLAVWVLIAARSVKADALTVVTEAETLTRSSARPELVSA